MLCLFENFIKILENLQKKCLLYSTCYVYKLARQQLNCLHKCVFLYIYVDLKQEWLVRLPVGASWKANTFWCHYTRISNQILLHRPILISNNSSDKIQVKLIILCGILVLKNKRLTFLTYFKLGKSIYLLK